MVKVGDSVWRMADVLQIVALGKILSVRDSLDAGRFVASSVKV